MHLGPPVIHCLGNTPGRIFPPSGCGNCGQANCIEQTTTSAAKRKNLVALMMTPVWRWLESALKGTSRPLPRSRIQCASATTISKAPLSQRFKQPRQRLQRNGGRQKDEVSRRGGKLREDVHNGCTASYCLPRQRPSVAQKVGNWLAIWFSEGDLRKGEK